MWERKENKKENIFTETLYDASSNPRISDEEEENKKRKNKKITTSKKKEEKAKRCDH